MSTEPIRKPRQVIPIAECCRRGNFRKATFQREIDAGRGPRVIRLSARRVGFFEDEFEEWLEPISKLLAAVDTLYRWNDAAHGRTVGTHSGSFSGGAHCRWSSWTQTNSD